MNHFTDENVYPIVGHDGLIEIKDLSGKAIGWLKVTIAFGTSHQINTFVSVLDEREKAKERTGISTDQILARERLKENEDTFNRLPPTTPIKEKPGTPQNLTPRQQHQPTPQQFNQADIDEMLRKSMEQFHNQSAISRSHSPH
jgi:hypothetical protein